MYYHSTSMNKHKSADRSRSLKIASLIFLAFVALAFIGAPLVGVFSDQFAGKVVFGSYNGKEIAYTPNNYFGQLVRSQLQNLESSESRNADRFSLQLIWQQGFDYMVYTTAVLQRARKAHMSIPEDIIKAEIQKIPFLQEDGSFSNRLYGELSNTYRKNLYESIETDYIVSRVQQDFSASTVLNQNQARFFATMGKELRAFDYVRFDRSGISDSFARDYFEKNKLLFSKLFLRSISRDNEEEAEQLRQQIQDGETTFDEQVQSDSPNEDQNDENDELYYYELKNEIGDEFATAITALSPNQLSQVIATGEGDYAFYQLISIEMAVFDDEDIRFEIDRYLRLFEATQVEEQNTQNANDFIELAKASSIDEAVRAFDLELGKTSSFSLNYNNSPMFSEVSSILGPGISSFSQEEDTLVNLFALKLYEFSEPISIGSFLYIFRVNEIEIEERAFPETTFYQYKQVATGEQLRESLVDESKLRSRFDKAFNSIYNFTEDEL